MAKRRRQATDEDVEDVNEKSGREKGLYEILGVDQNASQEQIRKAYHKLALRLHPDKNPDNESAKEKFQSLQAVIAILGDADKRKVYDETGSVEDVELSGNTFQNFFHFFRSLSKEQEMNSLASAIEAKFCGGRKSTGSKLDHEPSEEEFLAAQKRVMNRLKKKGTHDRKTSLIVEATYGGGRKNMDSKINREPSEEKFLAAWQRVTKRLKKKGT